MVEVDFLKKCLFFRDSRQKRVNFLLKTAAGFLDCDGLSVTQSLFLYVCPSLISLAKMPFKKWV